MATKFKGRVCARCGEPLGLGVVYALHRGIPVTGRLPKTGASGYVCADCFDDWHFRTPWGRWLWTLRVRLRGLLNHA